MKRILREKNILIGRSKPHAVLVVPKSFSFAYQKPPMLKFN